MTVLSKRPCRVRQPLSPGRSCELRDSSFLHQGQEELGRALPHLDVAAPGKKRADTGAQGAEGHSAGLGQSMLPVIAGGRRPGFSLKLGTPVEGSVRRETQS